MGLPSGGTSGSSHHKSGKAWKIAGIILVCLAGAATIGVVAYNVRNASKAKRLAAAEEAIRTRQYVPEDWQIVKNAIEASDIPLLKIVKRDEAVCSLDEALSMINGYISLLDTYYDQLQQYGIPPYSFYPPTVALI